MTVNVENAKLAKECERRRRCIPKSIAGIEFPNWRVLTLLSFYSNAVQNTNNIKEATELFEASLDDEDKQLLDNLLVNVSSDDTLHFNGDYFKKLELIVKSVNLAQIENKDQLDMKALFIKTFEKIHKDSKSQIIDTFCKIDEQDKQKSKEIELRHFYVKSLLSGDFNEEKTIQLNLIHHDIEKRKDVNNPLVGEYFKQKARFESELSQESNGLINRGHYEIMVNQIIYSLISVERNDNLQHDYVFSVNALLGNLDKIFKVVKIDDSLKTDIYNYVNNIHLYDVIDEKNFEKYQKFNRLFEITGFIDSAILERNACINSENEDGAKDAEQEVIKRCNELQEIVISLKEPGLVKFIEEFIQAIKNFLGIEPDVKLKFTASHQEGVVCNITSSSNVFNKGTGADSEIKVRS